MMNDNFYILILISVVGTALIFTGFILLQVKSHRRVLQQQQQLAAAEKAHQQALMQTMITSQEAERERIGNDLHDDIGAVLSSLRMLVEKHAATFRDASLLQQTTDIIDRVIKRSRELSHDLSPHISGRYGLVDALHTLCDTITTSGVLTVQLHCNEDDLPDAIPPTATVAIYRVIAELLHNTIKHAAATTVTIDMLMQEKRLSIRYSDDGKGIHEAGTAKSKGIGLQNIESRLRMLQAQWQMGNRNNSNGYHAKIVLPLA